MTLPTIKALKDLEFCQDLARRSQHTPGPWAIEDNTDDAVYIFGENTAVCKVGPKSDPSTYDDARLIAAAPDLLAALKGLNHMGGDIRGGYCICPRSNGRSPNHQHSTACADARTAIAKAEGRADA